MAFKMSNEDRAFLREMLNHRILTEDEERRLALRWINDKDERAVEEMIRCNQGLVWSQARKIWFARGRSFNVLDLFQEGNIALTKSARYFDPTEGNRFSSYATPAIKNIMSDFSRRVLKVVDPPLSAAARYRAIEPALVAWELQGEAIDWDYLLEITGGGESTGTAREWRLDTLRNIVAFYDGGGGSYRDIQFRDEEDNLTDVFDPSLVCDGVQEEVQLSERGRRVRNVVLHALEGLVEISKRDIEIFLLKNGFYSDNPISYDKIGKVYDLSGSRTQQVCADVSRTLASHEELRDLYDALVREDI